MSSKLYGAAAGALIVTLALTAGKQFARAEVAERKFSGCHTAFMDQRAALEQQSADLRQAKHEVQYYETFLIKAGYRIER